MEPFHSLRAQMPLLSRAIWLNAASSSPLPASVAEEGMRPWRELRDEGDEFQRWTREREAVRVRLARFIGAEPAQVAFVPSTSWAMHLVARMLVARGVRRVVTLAEEFPSTTIPLLHAGLELLVVEPDAEHRYALGAIERALAGAQAVALSQVQYATGFAIDAAAVGELCRARGALFALNGTQALGALPVDVWRFGCDFFCAASHKWMMAGFGGAHLSMREPAGDALPAASWLSVTDPLRMQNLPGAALTQTPEGVLARGAALRADASALEVGVTALGPIFALGAALAIQEQLGPERTARIFALGDRLREGLRRRGHAPITPDDHAFRSGICVVPSRAPAEAAKALAERGIHVAPRGLGIRISTHVYNTPDDVDRLLEALDGLAPAST